MGRASSLLWNMRKTRTLEWMGTSWTTSIMLVAWFASIHWYKYISLLGFCSNSRFNNRSFYKFLDKSFINSVSFFWMEKSMEIFEMTILISFPLFLREFWGKEFLREKILLTKTYCYNWSGRQDSNLQPSAPKLPARLNL